MSQITSDLDTSPLSQPITFSDQIVLTGYYTSRYVWDYERVFYGVDAAIAYGDSSFVYLLASSENGNYYIKTTETKRDDGEVYETEEEGTLISSYTYNGKTVYYKSSTFSFGALEDAELTPCVEADFSNGNVREIAWTLVYGDAVGTTVSIPVQWQTDYQTEPYEDTFDITVT